VTKKSKSATIEITHSLLVNAARDWLRSTQRCRVVAIELDALLDEIPDAIGWSSNARSILVECKISRADFRADQKKTSRQLIGGMGLEKYYMTPKGMINPSELPEGWGLVEYSPSGHSRGYFIKMVQKPPRQKNTSPLEDEWQAIARMQNEMKMLISITARSLNALSQVNKLSVAPDESEE